MKLFLECTVIERSILALDVKLIYKKKNASSIVLKFLKFLKTFFLFF